MRTNKNDIPVEELLDLSEVEARSETDARIVRKNFREPMIEEDAVSARIAGREYAVADVGSHGLGLAVDSLDDFAVGDVCNLVLQIGDRTMELSGTVAHISPSGAMDCCHCGIELSDMSKKNEEQLQRFLHVHHALLFGVEAQPC